MKTKKTTNIERHSYKKTDTVVYYIGSTFDEFWAASKDSDVHRKNKGNNIFLALKSAHCNRNRHIRSFTTDLHRK